MFNLQRQTATLLFASAAGVLALFSLGAAFAATTAKPVHASALSSTAKTHTQKAAEHVAHVSFTEEAEAYVGVLLPEQATDVAAPQAGLVKKVHVALGQVVPAGELLVSLAVEQATLELTRASAEREAARAGLRRARIEHTHAEREADRSVQLAREGLATDAQLAEARFKLDASRALTSEADARLAERAARAEQLAVVRDQANVLANFRGRVAVRYVSAGTLVAAGTPLLRLISDEAVLLRFAIPEHVTALQVGSHVTLVPEQHPQWQLQAHVLRVSPEIDAASRMRTLEATPLDAAAVVTKGLVGAIVSVRQTQQRRGP